MMMGKMVYRTHAYDTCMRRVCNRVCIDASFSPSPPSAFISCSHTLALPILTPHRFSFSVAGPMSGGHVR